MLQERLARRMSRSSAKSTGALVTGSLVVSPNGMSITFIKTGGILAPDTYTATLVSGANGFKSTSGALLDGNGDGVPGDNLVATFTVNPPAANAVVVSIPDFARGYGQPVNVPATSNAGLPITLSTGLNVSGVDLTLHYNPALLTITGFNTSIPGALATLNVTTPGTAILTVSSATQFSSSAGTFTLGDLTASVPNNAPYGGKEILDITGLSVFDNSPGVPLALPAVADDGIHVAAYFGDTNGDAMYSTQDATLEQRVIGLANSGFGFYKMTDPALLGGHHAERADSGQRYDEHPARGGFGQRTQYSGVAHWPGGAGEQRARPDDFHRQRERKSRRHHFGARTVDGYFRSLSGITVSGFQVAISYDPTKFTVSPVAQLGAMFSAAQGYAGTLTFPAPGELIFNASTGVENTPTIPVNTMTDLFTLTFTVAAGAANGTSVINLLNNIQTTTTAIFANDANLTQLPLSPAPTNNGTDSIDGIFTIGPAVPATTTTVSTASTSFNSAAQNVSLSTTVSSPGGTVNEGTVTFKIFNGTTVIGTSVTANVAANTAAAVYALPAGIAAGSYTIQAIYNGTANFGGSSSSNSLAVTATTSTTAVATASATFNGAAQNVTLNTTISSPGGAINEGTVTFEVLNGATVVGTAVTVNVVANAATAVYLLPAGTQGGTYTVQAVYNGTNNFVGSTNDSALVIAAAASATAAAAASATFNGAAQNVTLNTTINSAAGTINEGTVTFEILDGTIVIGTPVTVNVSANAAAAVYVLPAGAAGGTYIVQAVYNGTQNFAGSTNDNSLIIAAAASATAVASAAATFNGAAQNVTLNTTITSPAGLINEGTETFTIFNGTTLIGAPVTVYVSAGAAAAVYVLPADSAAGTCVVQAVYNGTNNFAGSTNNNALVIAAAASRHGGRHRCGNV